MKKVEKLRRTRKKWKFMCKVFWRSNLKVFVEEAWLLHHSDLLFLFVFPNEGELFGEGRTQPIVVGRLYVSHFHLLAKTEDNMGGFDKTIKNITLAEISIICYFDNVTFVFCH